MNKHEIEAYKEYDISETNIICPHCGEELKIITPAINHADNNGAINTKALCCGKMVRISAIRTYSALKWEGEFDDYNQKCN